MAYKPRTLFRIISDINTDIFLPHIQRPFVWEVSQMDKLFDSLMRGYPVQTLLFWKTKEDIKARKFMDVINPELDLHTLYDENKSQSGVEKVFVLDGQQRIQTLFCLYAGKLVSSGNKELEAYVDITSSEVDEETGQVYNLKFFEVGATVQLPLFRIKDVMYKYGSQSADEIGDDVNESLDTILADSDSAKKDREKRVRKNIGRMRAILKEENNFWVEELDGVANSYPYATILEIFVRVNSGGTKLDASDLMFAAMKELSPKIEENLENMAELLSNGGVDFEIESILKCLLLVNDKGAAVNPNKFSGAAGTALVKSIDDNWDTRYIQAFQALRDFIVNDLKLDSPKVVRSQKSLVPIFEYLFFNLTPTHANKTRLKAFFYKAQLFNWFSSSTDGILDYLHNNYLKSSAGSDFPITQIMGYFDTRKKNTSFDRNTLTDHSLRYFLLHLLYVEKNSTSAFNVLLKNNAPHIDHIYPKSKLAKPPFSLQPSDVNHIGNYRFVGANDNIRKRAEDPASYFGKVSQGGFDIARHLLVTSYSANPDLLKMDLTTYLDFRNKRLDEIYNIIEPIINFK
ncbi:DUF262 domain-containing protein [Sphingobacterium sp.]|uniref:DUF262 domain-containing protein n=1 Tax=Sphingobacterium sp. TaxID=341027 RepID=UPI0031DF9E83